MTKKMATNKTCLVPGRKFSAILAASLLNEADAREFLELRKTHDVGAMAHDSPAIVMPHEEKPEIKQGPGQAGGPLTPRTTTTTAADPHVTTTAVNPQNAQPTQTVTQAVGLHEEKQAREGGSSGSAGFEEITALSEKLFDETRRELNVIKKVDEMMKKEIADVEKMR
ncbi:unnamed protein product [Amoebophrya sp. A25]|nr:unnamed protein product [Amoebophrya sp. A25]|eukprot:GSA25T00015009001.1